MAKEVRLQRYLAQSGVAARRKAEDLITAGKVKVNGKVVTELGSKVDPDGDRVEVDGEAVHPEDLFYVLLNKPKGCLTAVSDDTDRPTVMDYLPNLPARIAPVGRLDFFSEGVLLLTNDGNLSAALQAPKSHAEKTYHVKVHGRLEDEELKRLRTGIRLDDGTMTQPAQIDRLSHESKHEWLVITITEGKNRQIHRMVEALGHQVVKLQRVAFAGLTFHDLRVGDARELSQDEVNELYRTVKIPRDPRAVARGKWRAVREDTDHARRNKHPVLEEPGAHVDDERPRSSGGDRVERGARRPAGAGRGAPSRGAPSRAPSRGAPSRGAPSRGAPAEGRSFGAPAARRGFGDPSERRGFGDGRGDRRGGTGPAPSGPRAGDGGDAVRRPSGPPRRFDEGTPAPRTRSEGRGSDGPRSRPPARDGAPRARPEGRSFDGPRSRPPARDAAPRARPEGRGFDGPRSRPPARDGAPRARPEGRGFDGPRSRPPARDGAPRARPEGRGFDGPRSRPPARDGAPRARPEGRGFDGPRSRPPARPERGAVKGPAAPSRPGNPRSFGEQRAATGRPRPDGARPSARPGERPGFAPRKSAGVGSRPFTPRGDGPRGGAGPRGAAGPGRPGRGAPSRGPSRGGPRKPGGGGRPR